MNYSLFLARRLSLSSGNKKKSPAIRVSVTAVALSIAVMLASIAIVLGFKREIREKITGFNSDITIYASPDSSDDNNVLTLTPSLTGVLDNQSYIKDFSLEASIPAILKTPEDFKGIYFRSINGKTVKDFISGNLIDGSIPDFTKEENRDKILLSKIAVDQLGLKTGEKIDIYFIGEDVKVQRLIIAGVFNTHFDSYDRVMAYGSLALIQKIAGLTANQGTNIQVHINDFSSISDNTYRLGETLQRALADGTVFKAYRIDNALRQGEGYFNWLSLLDTNVIVILVLMTVVSVATLISGMLILILDKKRFIGVTRAMGASVKGVRKVFVYLALKVAFYGMIIGNLIMLVFLYCQDRWHFLPLDPNAYYIDFVPVEINWWYVVVLNVASFIIIYLCLIIPSRFVAKISPVDAMRTSE